MWLPMVVSVSALATGLAGIVATNDWRLLLVVSAATGFSEAVGQQEGQALTIQS